MSVTTIIPQRSLPHIGVGERVRELEGELSAKEEELNFLRFELEMKENEKKVVFSGLVQLQ